MDMRSKTRERNQALLQAPNAVVTMCDQCFLEAGKTAASANIRSWPLTDVLAVDWIDNNL